jgi:hypothetical protein
MECYQLVPAGAMLLGISLKWIFRALHVGLVNEVNSR